MQQAYDWLAGILTTQQDCPFYQPSLYNAVNVFINPQVMFCCELGKNHGSLDSYCASVEIGDSSPLPLD